jgi:hypothetical protein
MMNKKYRAGGLWFQPWATLDHVRSQLLHARALLLRGVPQDMFALFNADEVDLLSAINEALAAVERIVSSE